MILLHQVLQVLHNLEELNNKSVKHQSIEWYTESIQTDYHFFSFICLFPNIPIIICARKDLLCGGMIISLSVFWLPATENVLFLNARRLPFTPRMTRWHFRLFRGSSRGSNVWDSKKRTWELMESQRRWNYSLRTVKIVLSRYILDTIMVKQKG